MSEENMWKGWIHLHRKIQDCFLWDSDEKFDSRSAWIDLLLLANHEDKNTMFDGKPIVVKKGQRITSVRSLAERWHWSNEKTLKYLRMLDAENMIIKDSDNKRTLLTIVNYEFYNDTQNTEQYTEPNADRTQTERRTATNKNDKNDKNEKKEDIFVELGGVEKVVELWKSLSEFGIPSLRGLSDKRKSQLKQRLFEYGPNSYLEIIEQIRNSDFLRGSTGKWKVTFDWVVCPSNYPKVLEGNYANKTTKSNSPWENLK